MVSKELRLPIFVTVATKASSIFLPFNSQSISRGKSPSATKQLSCVYCPSCRGLSSKENGVMRGGTEGKEEINR